MAEEPSSGRFVFPHKSSKFADSGRAPAPGSCVAATLIMANNVLGRLWVGFGPTRVFLAFRGLGLCIFGVVIRPGELRRVRRRSVHFGGRGGVWLAKKCSLPKQTNIIYQTRGSVAIGHVSSDPNSQPVNLD